MHSSGAQSPIKKRQQGAMLNGMYQLWKTQDLCDVIIVAKNGITKCHKVALAAHSSLMARMISDYAPDDIVRIRLPEYCLDAICTVLNFVYTSNGDLSSDNISQVISLMIKLGLTNLKDHCKNYLVDCCNIDNAVFHYSIALNNKLFEVAQILFNIIADNFSAVVNTTQFLYLSCERLLPFIKCCHLNVNNEMEVFMAVVNWVNFDKANRICDAKKLMADVHFEDIHADDLLIETERSRWLLSEASPVREIIFDVIRNQCIRSKNNCCIHPVTNGTVWNVSDGLPVGHNFCVDCPQVASPCFNCPCYTQAEGRRKKCCDIINRYSDVKMCNLSSNLENRSDLSLVKCSPSFKEDPTLPCGPKSFLNRQYDQFKEINGRRDKKRGRAAPARSPSTVSGSDYRGRKGKGKRGRRKSRRRYGLTPKSSQSTYKRKGSSRSLTPRSYSPRSFASTKSGSRQKSLAVPSKLKASSRRLKSGRSSHRGRKPSRRHSKLRKKPSRSRHRHLRVPSRHRSRSSTRSGKSLKSGRSGRSGRSSRSGRSGRSGKSLSRRSRGSDLSGKRRSHKSGRLSGRGSGLSRGSKTPSKQYLTIPGSHKSIKKDKPSQKRHKRSVTPLPSRKDTKSNHVGRKTFDRQSKRSSHRHSRQLGSKRSDTSRTRSTTSRASSARSKKSNRSGAGLSHGKIRSDRSVHKTFPSKKESSRRLDRKRSRDSTRSTKHRPSGHRSLAKSSSKKRPSKRSISAQSRGSSRYRGTSSKNVSKNANIATFKIRYLNPDGKKKSGIKNRCSSHVSATTTDNDMKKLHDFNRSGYAGVINSNKLCNSSKDSLHPRESSKTNNASIGDISSSNNTPRNLLQVNNSKFTKQLHQHLDLSKYVEGGNYSSLSYNSPFEHRELVNDDFDKKYFARESSSQFHDSNYSVGILQNKGNNSNDNDNTMMHFNMKAQDAPYLFMIGGFDLQSSDRDIPGKAVMALSLNPQNNSSWLSVTLRLEQHLHHHQSAIVNGKLYLIGGAIFKPEAPEILGTATDGVTIFDFKTGEWRLGQSMQFSRAYFNMARWRDKLIIVGGEDDAGMETDQIDIYDTPEDCWRVLTHHPGGPRLGVAIAVLNNKLYVVGGYSESKRHRGELLNDVFCYDILMDQWSALNSLQKPISHATLEVVNNSRLILMGGRTLTKSQKSISSDSIFIFIEKQNYWKEVGNLTVGRHDMASAVLKANRNKTFIYLVGGMSNPRPAALKMVECVAFDEEIERATVSVINSVPFSVTGTACCIVK